MAMRSCFDIKKERAHIRIDTPEEVILDIASNCKKCGRCCKNGSGFLVKDDAENISAFLGITPEKLKQDFLEKVRLFEKARYRPKLKPNGNCVFLQANRCSIHPVKPYQCKVSIMDQHSKDLNDWFMLNFFVDKDNKKSVKDWLVRESLNGSIPGGKPEDLR